MTTQHRPHDGTAATPHLEEAPPPPPPQQNHYATVEVHSLQPTHICPLLKSRSELELQNRLNVVRHSNKNNYFKKDLHIIDAAPSTARQHHRKEVFLIKSCTMPQIAGCQRRGGGHDGEGVLENDGDINGGEQQMNFNNWQRDVGSLGKSLENGGDFKSAYIPVPVN